MSELTIKQKIQAFTKAKNTVKDIIKFKVYYAFVLPYLSIFIAFTIIPVLIAIFYSFTQFNILEAPKFIWFDNYKNLLLNDDIFIIAIKNTIFFAAITGPVSYMMCLLLAWFVNDLSPRMRTFLTLLFYAPTLSNIYFIWLLFFSSDSYGFLNSYLIKMRVILEPIQWLTDENYMVPVLIVIILWSSLGTGFLAFVAGFQNVDRTLYEAGAVDGIRNRWQELWFITLPYMKPQLLFGAVMSITGSFSIGPVISALAGFPSTNYAAHTIMNHLDDYGGIRFEMGYACAIATILFVIMITANKLVQKLISKVGK